MEHGGGGSNFFWLPGWCRQWPWRGKVTRRADTGVRCRILHWTLTLAIHIQLYNAMHTKYWDRRFQNNRNFHFKRNACFWIRRGVSNSKSNPKHAEKPQIHLQLDGYELSADDKITKWLWRWIIYSHLHRCWDKRIPDCWAHQCSVNIWEIGWFRRVRPQRDDVISEGRGHCCAHEISQI